MRKIGGVPKSVGELLSSSKYTIHYYQREYLWQTNHIEELLEDLTQEFLEQYHDGDDRTKVASFGVYFLGSIVITGDDKAVIDGQRRLTSLTLLLMYLLNRLKKLGLDEDVDLVPLIRSNKHGKLSFTIDVPERQDVMTSIYNDQPFDTEGKSESVQNLYNRYMDIKNGFPEEITDQMLLHFCDWIIDNVQFIEITATTEQDAYKVFITMNDRGLRLTPTEMLKGYLLSEVKDDLIREQLNNEWKSKIQKLKADNDNGDDSFIKNWLRSQYAETIRDNKAGAEPRDFDNIGGAFHKWVRDEHLKLGLKTSSDFEKFIRKMLKYADVYMLIKQAEAKMTDGLESVFYNASVQFTQQVQLLLAPISENDSQDIIKQKITLVAKFIDNYIIARVVNYKSVDYNTVKYYVFTVTKQIRGNNITTLKKNLKEECDNFASKANAAAIADLGLNSFTKKYIKHILARITSYIEEKTNVQPKYEEYMAIRTKNPFEIEHIITDHYDWYKSEYADETEFRRWRNNIGNLLLLHKSINASINDSKYSEKLPTYASNEGNIYTESLTSKAYVNNPRFVDFIKNNALPFREIRNFNKSAIAERNSLVAKLVALIWNNDDFN